MVPAYRSIDVKLLDDRCVYFTVDRRDLLIADSEVVAEIAGALGTGLHRRRCHGVLITLKVIATDRSTERAAREIKHVAVEAEMNEPQPGRVGRFEAWRNE